MGKLYINDKLKNIKPYVVDKTEYKIKLDANESYIPFPAELEEELKKAVTDVLYNRYPDPDAEELCRLYGAYCGIDSRNITAGNGSDELIQILINGFLENGDTLLTVKPDFSMYKFYASLMGAKVVEYDMGEEFIFDRDSFLNLAKNSNTRMIIFSNPNNPTGGVISAEDILYMVENTDALVVVDEAYYEFYGKTVIDKIYAYENLAVLRTCSKAMGLAAARVGFLAAGDEIISNVRKVKPPFNVNSLSQAAASVVLKNRNMIERNIEEIKAGRDNLYSALSEAEQEWGSDTIKVYPTYSNFIYMKSPISKQIFEGLKKKNIIIRYFGDFLRINTGSPYENESFIEAFRNIVEQYSGGRA